MWKNRYKKAVTFSYDDGIEQDKRLVELLNQYHLKATFNINTGLEHHDHDFFIEGHHMSHIPLEAMVALYQGHEIAVHTFSHPHLTQLKDEEVLDEMTQDMTLISQVFHQQPMGMAYPYGSYDDRVVALVKSLGLRYARTVESNHQTSLQQDLLRFQPTCHHNDPKIFELIDQFLTYKGEEPQLFYIWGHSYEADVDQNWDHIESIFKKIAFHKDIYYGTNREVLIDNNQSFVDNK